MAVEFPEFPERITAKVWKAAFSRLDVPKFREFFSGGLAMAETEELYSWSLTLNCTILLPRN